MINLRLNNSLEGPWRKCWGKAFFRADNCPEVCEKNHKKRFADTSNGKHTITGHISSLFLHHSPAFLLWAGTRAKCPTRWAKWGQRSKNAINAQVHLQLLPQWMGHSELQKKQNRDGELWKIESGKPSDKRRAKEKHVLQPFDSVRIRI